MGRVISLVYTLAGLILIYFLLSKVNTMFLELVNKFSI